MFSYPRIIAIICNFMVIIYSIYISMVIYQVIDSVAHADSYHKDKCTPDCSRYFRGDRMELRNTIYQNLDMFQLADEDKEKEDDTQEDGNETQKEKDHTHSESQIYTPYKVCYVNSYVAYDSNSTMFDYTRESEYDTYAFETILGNIHNKMYMVFDDIHIVFSVRDQRCVKYPDIISRD
jgi:hypothetical protein